MFHSPCGGEVKLQFLNSQRKVHFTQVEKKGKGSKKKSIFVYLVPLPLINSAIVYMFRKRIYMHFRSVRTSYRALHVRSSTHPATIFPSPNIFVLFLLLRKELFSISRYSFELRSYKPKCHEVKSQISSFNVAGLSCPRICDFFYYTVTLDGNSLFGCIVSFIR